MSILILPAAYIGLLCLYVLPSILAFRRHHPNRWVILAINVLLGPPGWVIALIWVLYAVLHPAPVQGTVGGRSGLNISLGGVSGPNGGPLGGRSGPTGTMSPGEAVGELERLGLLKAGGYIDDAEFAALKAAVLAQL